MGLRILFMMEALGLSELGYQIYTHTNLHQ